MIKFVKLKIDRNNKKFRNIHFLEDVFNLYKKYERYLNDDYTKRVSLLDVVINC